MIKIQRFVVNPLEENCYVLSDETKQAIIVDDGAFYPGEREAIQRYLEQNDLRPVYLLQTHGHGDHTMGVADFQSLWDIPVLLHPADEDLFLRRSPFGEYFRKKTTSVAKRYEFFPTDGIIRWGCSQLQILYTPGHTPGGVCFYNENDGILLSGDTIFQGSIGRTDLEGGSSKQLLESIRQCIMTLPKDVTILPGHGPETTVENEMQNNSYL